MTTLQLITLITAIGGFVLGLVNLGINLYKDFWRKGQLTAHIETKAIRGIGAGQFDFQINFIMRAKVRDIYIKDVRLEAGSQSFGSFMKEHNRVEAYKAIAHTTFDLLKMDEDAFVKDVGERFKTNPVYLRDYKVSKDSQISLTLTDRIGTTREPDGYADVSKDGWVLVIDHTDGICRVPFDFDKHYTNKGYELR